MKKQCVVCKDPKEQEDFPIKRVKRKKGASYEYRGSMCKSCTNKRQYERRKSNPEAYERMLERSRKRGKKQRTIRPEINRAKVQRWTKKKIEDGEFKSIWLLAKYGITLDDYNRIREEQDYKCKICGKPEDELGYLLNVDHCHTTSKVRGFLCRGCNTSLGNVKDSVEVLKNMIKYLQDT